MTRLGITTLALIALAATAGGPGPLRGQQPAGRVQGVVTIDRTLEARRLSPRLYAEIGGSPVPATTPATGSERRNVVIYVDSAPWTGGVRGSVTMRQSGEAFVPHILPVARGTTVAFPNDDPVFHNVFSLSSAKSFDLGRYPMGESKAVTFNQAGVVQVFCHIHADMSAVVLVLDNPWFTTADADGSYTLEVPPGERTIVAWHERAQPVTRRVLVTAGEITRLDWTIPLDSERQPRD